MSEQEQSELLKACRQGNPVALRDLVDAHYDLLYRFLWRLTGSPEDAAELTQESFVRALERMKSFDGRSRFSTWLHAIAVNVWKDEKRRTARRAHFMEEMVLESEVATDPGEREALRHLEGMEVRRAIEKLPEAQRLAILLFFYEEMSYREIAGVCRCPIGTVGSWIHHGVRTLRQLLSDPATDVSDASTGPDACADGSPPGRRSGRPRPACNGEEPR